MTSTTSEVLTFARIQEARDWAHAFWPPRTHFTADELEAVRAYTGHSSSTINRTLREGLGPNTIAWRYHSRDFDFYKKNIDSAIRKCPPTSADMYVYRYTEANMFKEKYKFKWEPEVERYIGKKYKDKAYLSTSLSSRLNIMGSIRLKVLVPAGSRGIYVSGRRGREGSTVTISAFGAQESEIIFARGSSLKLLSLKPKRSGYGFAGEAVLFQPKRP